MPKRTIFKLTNRSDGVGYKIDEETGCWNWMGAGNAGGYGTKVTAKNGNRKQQSAHRWYYEQTVGPVPEGLELDHLCRNRRCINPDHLEPVTRSENLRRGRGTGNLDYEQRAEVIRRYRRGKISLSQLGRDCGVTPQAVWYLVRSWSKVVV